MTPSTDASTRARRIGAGRGPGRGERRRRRGLRWFDREPFQLSNLSRLSTRPTWGVGPHRLATPRGEALRERSGAPTIQDLVRAAASRPSSSAGRAPGAGVAAALAAMPSRDRDPLWTPVAAAPLPPTRRGAGGRLPLIVALSCCAAAMALLVVGLVVLLPAASSDYSPEYHLVSDAPGP